jgi:excisionase family DNA binding protein
MADPASIEPILLDLRRAADYISVPPETLRTWIRQKKFRSVLIGRRRLVVKADIDDFIRQQLEGGDEQ